MNAAIRNAAQGLLALGLLCALPPEQSAAASFPQWGELTPGPYAVGFKTVSRYDHTRAVRPQRGFDGSLAGEETARFLRISTWYPAETDSAAPRMPYEHYVYLTPQDATVLPSGALYLRTRLVDEPALSEQTKEQGRRGFAGLYTLLLGHEPTAEQVAQVLATPTGAVENAKALAGPFPVILYGLGATATNSVLCEYLASHGFVVITSPDVGANSWVNNGGGHFMAAEIQASDLAYLTGYAHELPNADTGRLGLLAYSFGTAAQLVLQLRHMTASAVASLQGWEAFPGGIGIVRQSSYSKDLTRMRVPLLFVAGELGREVDWSLFDSWHYSERWRLWFPGLKRSDFVSHRMIVGATTPEQKQGYELMARHVLAFFDAYLRGSAEGLAWLQQRTASAQGDFGRLERIPAAAPVPTQEEVWNLVWEDGGIHRLRELYETVRSRDDKAGVFFEEDMLNMAGYRFLRNGRLAEALEVMKLNAEAFPSSANAHDSLAEAYLAHQQKEPALVHFRRSLSLDPSNSHAAEMIEKLSAAATAGGEP